MMLSEADANADAPPRAGHNNPPAPTVAERLAEIYGLEIAKVEALAERANNAPKEITNAEQRAIVADIAADADALGKALDRLREVEKKPHLDAGRAIDAYFKENGTVRTGRIEAAMTQRLTAYRKAELAAEQKRQEEAARKAREQAEAASFDAAIAEAEGRHDDAEADTFRAAASEAAAEQIADSQAPRQATVTAAGTRVSDKTALTFEIVDYDAIPLDKLRPYLKREDVEKALRAYLRFAKENAKLPGVRFFEDLKVKTGR